MNGQFIARAPISGVAVNTLDRSQIHSKPSLLLHICCAPCATHVIDLLREEFAITAFFYNPNIYPRRERHRRLQEARQLCKRLGVDFLAGDTDAGQWLRRMRGRRQDFEGGPHCSICFWIRLAHTADVAQNRDFDYFATTLTVSPHKDVTAVNRMGQKAGRGSRSKFYPADFKKQDGFQHSCRLSQEYGLYRQNYCGCVYSLGERLGRGREPSVPPRRE